MNLFELWGHPITQALFDGAKYTASKVMPAIQTTMMAKPVTEDDINKSAESTAKPDFGDDPQNIDEVLL